MFKYNCQVCKKEHDQDNTHLGDIVYGGYGSTKYDETKLVWVASVPKALELGGHICDGCIDQQVENGALEAYSSAFLLEETTQMSAKGYAKLFEMGARDMYAICVSARGALPDPVIPLTKEATDAIVKLRGSIRSDPSRDTNVVHVARNPEHGLLSRELGKAHVLAGMILGLIGGKTPDFSPAAEDFGRRLEELDNQTCDLFEDMMAVAEATSVR